MLQKAASVSACLGRHTAVALFQWEANYLEPWATTVLGFLMPAWAACHPRGVRRTSGVTVRAGSSSPALDWAHGNQRTWWLQWNFGGALCFRQQMQYSTSGQTTRAACIWAVPHSESSAFFGPNHDQEPWPAPPQPWEELGVDSFSGCTWPTLSGEIPVQQMRPNISPGMWQGQGHSWLLPYPETSWGDSTSPDQGGRLGWWKSKSKTEGALPHRKCWCLARGSWRPPGAERVTKTLICLSACQEGGDLSSHLLTRQKASHCCDCSEGGGTFPGRWVMWVWPAHRLTEHPPSNSALQTPACFEKHLLITFRQRHLWLKAMIPGFWRQTLGLGLNAIIPTTEQLNKKTPYKRKWDLKKSPVWKKSHIFNFDPAHDLGNTLVDSPFFRYLTTHSDK